MNKAFVIAVLVQGIELNRSIQEKLRAIPIVGDDDPLIRALLRKDDLIGIEVPFHRAEHLLTAGAFVQSFVPLVVFFSLQRYFVRGLLAGSVKG